MSVAAWLVLLMALLVAPAEAAGFALSLPPSSVVTIGSPSRLTFTATNTGASEGLSRLTLRFPSGYRVKGGAAPPTWTAEVSAEESSEISFRTEDEAKCTGAIAPGSSLTFGVEVIAPTSGTVTPDRLVSGEGEQSCRGVTLDAPPALPSWDRLGMQVALAAAPPMVGLGGIVTVTMTVANLSTVELTEVVGLLTPVGTGSVIGMAGPMPSTLALAAGASGSMTWSGRAGAVGEVGFSGQAVSPSVTSSPVGSETLVVSDLEVSLSVAPGEVTSGQAVQVQMTVRNRGPVRVTDVTLSPLTFDGTATTSASAGPSPASMPALEPGQAAVFVWGVTIAGTMGETYAFSGWAWAEGGNLVSVQATSNRGTVAQAEAGSPPSSAATSGTLGGGGGASASAGSTSAPVGTSAAATTGGGGSAPPASASLQFVSINHNGSQTGGAAFSTALVGDLKIVVGWQNISGSHTQRLELFTPAGSLYQRITAQFAGASTVEARLPVSGTWITEYSLFGAWGVEVYLDGARVPMTTGAFVLSP